MTKFSDGEARQARQGTTEVGFAPHADVGRQWQQRLHALEPLVVQPGAQPDDRRVRQQVDGEQAVAAVRACPIEGGAQVVELTSRGDAGGHRQGPALALDGLDVVTHHLGVTPQPGIDLAGCYELLHRKGARAFEHAVARHAAGFVARGHDQRLLDEVPEQFEHRPTVQLFVRSDELRELERKAAGEHPEAPEHDPLVDRQQLVAPVECGAQCLVLAQRHARAAGQHPEALAQVLAQAVDAKHRHARGGQFERQRQPIEPPADVDDRLAIGGLHGEVRDQCANTLQEQLHGTVGRDVRIRRGVRNGQRLEPVDVLAGNLEQLLAGGEHAHARRGGDDALDHIADDLDQVFAIVENDQSLERRKPLGEVLRGLPWAQRHAEGGGDRRRDQRRIGDRCQLDEPGAVGPAIDLQCGHRQRKTRLADSARADDRHDAAFAEARRQCREVAIAAIQRRGIARQIGARCSRRRGRLLPRRLRGLGGSAFHDQREAVAAPGDRRDRLRAEQLAQRHDLHLQIVLLHHEPVPCERQQLPFGNDALAPLDQRQQHIEGTRAEARRLAIDQHLAQAGVDHDRAAAVGGVCRGGLAVIHGRDCRRHLATRKAPPPCL